MLTSDQKKLLILAAVAGVMVYRWQNDTAAQIQSALDVADGVVNAGSTSMVDNIYNKVVSMTKQTMTISDAGIAAITQREGGARLQEYLDSAGLRTIGVGHLCGTFEHYPNGITQDQSDALLRGDLSHAEDAVNALVNVSLTQAQFDALVSFVFNVGAGAFKQSSALLALNAGDYAGAAANMAKFNKIHSGGVVVASAGLTNRRNSEINQFMYA